MLTTLADSDYRVLCDETYDFMNSPHIRVVVSSGDAIKRFIVHETLITQASDSFKAAMAGERKESEQRTVPLPDDEPEIFSLYLMFLYSNALPVNTATNGDDERLNQYLLLSKLYILAGKLLDETTKTTILEALSACAQETSYATLPDHESVCTIYDATVEFSPVRARGSSMCTQPTADRTL